MRTLETESLRREHGSNHTAAGPGAAAGKSAAAAVRGLAMWHSTQTKLNQRLLKKLRYQIISKCPVISDRDEPVTQVTRATAPADTVTRAAAGTRDTVRRRSPSHESRAGPPATVTKSPRLPEAVPWPPARPGSGRTAAASARRVGPPRTRHSDSDRRRSCRRRLGVIMVFQLEVRRSIRRARARRASAHRPGPIMKAAGAPAPTVTGSCRPGPSLQ